MRTDKLKGIIVSVMTPMKQDGSLNIDVLDQYLEWLIAEGVHGLLIVGTAGQYANLLDEERQEMATRAVKIANGRVPVIVHTGHSNRDSTLALTRHAERIGADGVMVVPPAVVKPTQDEIERFFRDVAAATSLDVVIYNNPGRVAVNVAPQTLVKLSEVRNIAALKDSGRNLAELTEVINRAGDRLTILSGEGDFFLATLALGGVGGILTVVNIAPRKNVQMYEAFLRGDLPLARRLNDEIITLGKVIGSEGKFHSGIKTGMRLIGIPIGPPRLPLTVVSEETEAKIRRQIEVLGLPSAS